MAQRPIRHLKSMLHRVQSPKLTSENRRTAIYPYYAGFSEGFVQSVIDNLEITDAHMVADPWNGSGTTTTVCAQQGIPSVGIDINPAMKSIAAVRADCSGRLIDAAESIQIALAMTPVSDDSHSPFNFSGTIFKAAESLCEADTYDALKFGLMASCRRLSRSERSKNPTWYSRKRLSSLRIPEPVIRATISDVFAQLRDLSPSRAATRDVIAPHLIISDVLNTQIKLPITHVITSPPYLTRIDYAMKTLPELLFLENLGEVNIDELRRKMLGSVLTCRDSDISVESFAANEVISKVRSHKSKASSSYYFRFTENYFCRLEESIKSILSFSNEISTFILVSQGSYYKDIFIDLPYIVSDILAANGFRARSASDFYGKNNMVGLNRRAAASMFKSPPEVASVFER